jgi:hypothetical protein
VTTGFTIWLTIPVSKLLSLIHILLCGRFYTTFCGCDRRLNSRRCRGRVQTVNRSMSCIFTVLILSFAVAACDESITIQNVSPVVTAVGPVVQDGDDVRVVFWVVDYEEDPVDVSFEWIDVQSGQAQNMTVHGGHGTVGLTTTSVSGGASHVVYWQAGGVGPDLQIKLRVTAVDSKGAQSKPFESPAFSIQAGLAAP